MKWLKGAKGFFTQQKVYLVVFAVLLYAAAKVYVSSTPSPDDDAIPDQVKSVVVEWFAEGEDLGEPTGVYGETS